MESRFFVASSGSDEDTESETEEQVVPVLQTATSSYQRGALVDTLQEYIQAISNARKIHDMSKVTSAFDSSASHFQRNKKIIEERGPFRPFIKCIADLEDWVADIWGDADAKKAMSKVNRTHLQALRQKTKKHNRDFTSLISDYRKNPGKYEEVESEGEESEPEEEEEDEEEDGSEEGSDEEACSSGDDEWPSDSDDDLIAAPVLTQSGRLTAAMFLKTAPEFLVEDPKKDPKKDPKDKREPRALREPGTARKKVRETEVAREKVRLFAKDEEVTPESIAKKFDELMGRRGKRSTVRGDLNDLFKELADLVKERGYTEALRVKVLFGLVSSLFDRQSTFVAMKKDQWAQVQVFVSELIRSLQENLNILCIEDLTEEEENYKTEPFKLRGNTMHLVERMDEEYTKLLQTTDQHSTDYVERLKDEPAVSAIIDQLCRYYETMEGTTEAELCRVYLRKIYHLYYKYSTGKLKSTDADTPERLEKLCEYIYNHDKSDRLRSHAILCHIYFLALHDDWYRARDLFIMSHLTQSVGHADAATMILYNRALAEAGLCAFRAGHMRDCHQALMDLQGTTFVKELLGQGIATRITKTKEQERLERQLQTPYHMHISQDLVECCYLISAMLVEIPQLFKETARRLRPFSRNFHHILRQHERMTLAGPPDTMRDHIVYAAKALKLGDWRKCVGYLVNEKMDKKVWRMFPDATATKDLVSEKVKEECLRCYLFSYSSCYDNIRLATLAKLFEMPETQVHAILAKMIIQGDLLASLDEPTASLTLQHTEPTQLHQMALQLTDKLQHTFERNAELKDEKQKVFVAKSGGTMFATFEKEDKQQQWQSGGFQGRGDRGGQRRNWGNEGRSSNYQGNRGYHHVVTY